MANIEQLSKRLEVKRTMNLSRSEIWKVMADFPNIHVWNSGVKHSESIGESVEGVGAERLCTFVPFGQADETVAEWVENERMVIDIHSVKGLPLKRGRASFEMSGDDQTTLTIVYRYQPNFMGRLMGPIFRMMLTKGFKGFLADLEIAATK